MLTLTVGGASVVVSYWLGWDVAALFAAETLAGFGFAMADGEPDEEPSAI